MYSVSTEYTKAIRAMTRTERLTGTIKFTDGTTAQFTHNHIGSGGCSLSRQSVTGEELEIGAVIASELSIHFKTKRSRFSFANVEIDLSYGIRLSDGTWYDVPLGIFKAYETRRVGDGVTISAYDYTTKLDKRYFGQILAGTPYGILSKICTLCGMELGMTEADLSSYPNALEIIRIDSTSECKTYWDCVKQVAIVLGSFGAVDTTGALVMKRYSQAVTQTLTNKNRYTLNPCDFVCKYSTVVLESVVGPVYTSNQTGVQTRAAANTAGVLGVGILGAMVLGSAGSTDETPAIELPLVIRRAACWNTGKEDALQARCDRLQQEVAGLPYTPASWTMPGDPAMEPGDRILHETDNGSLESLVTAVRWKFNSRMSVESAGANIGLSQKQTMGNDLPLKDYNGDGKIDLSDVDTFRERLVQEDTTFTLEDDWNGDGVIDVLDVVYYRSLVTAYLGAIPNTSTARAGEVVVAEEVQDGIVKGTTTKPIPFDYRGVCGNADEAITPGTYLLTGTSTNCPVTSGFLVVFGDTQSCVQLAFDDAATTRSVRTVWDGTVKEWQDA